MNERRVDTIDQTGSPDDVEATALTITSREIEAVLLSTEPLADRRKQLKRMRAELAARMESDEDLRPLAREIDAALERIAAGRQS